MRRSLLLPTFLFTRFYSIYTFLFTATTAALDASRYERDPALATVPSAIATGAGQIYAGTPTKGMTRMTATAR